jgi:hypothetical protein
MWSKGIELHWGNIENHFQATAKRIPELCQWDQFRSPGSKTESCEDSDDLCKARKIFPKPELGVNFTGWRYFIFLRHGSEND